MEQNTVAIIEIQKSREDLKKKNFDTDNLSLLKELELSFRDIDEYYAPAVTLLNSMYNYFNNNDN